MAKVTRVFPYVNGRQIFTMPAGYASNVRYHCWGGGGGGGGDSCSQLGGNGSAGVYTTGEVYLNKGDQVEVVVAGGGQEGRSIDSNRKLFSMTLRVAILFLLALGVMLMILPRQFIQNTIAGHRQELTRPGVHL